MTPTSGHSAHCWHTAMLEPISLAILLKVSTTGMEQLLMNTPHTNIRPLGTLLAYSHARARFIGHLTKGVYNWHGVTTNEHSLHQHQATRHTAVIHARAHLVGHPTKGVYNGMQFLVTSTHDTNIRPLGTPLAYMP